MTLDDFKLTCEQCIRANFKIRNARAFNNESRQLRLVAARRESLRKWIRILRLANDPESALSIAEAVRWKIA
jgi:hypothetical protein